MDVQTLGGIALVVAIVAFVLYVWDRRTKQAPVDVMDGAKLALGAGGIVGGVAYAVGMPVEDVAETVAASATAVQDMFVGKPEF